MANLLEITKNVQDEETQRVPSASKRSSSLGVAFKRLFAKSPSAQERSNSETSISVLGSEQTSPLTLSLRGGRGRTPPNSISASQKPSEILENSKSPSTLPPNNLFYCPIKAHNDSISSLGGLNISATPAHYYDRLTRSAMAAAQTAAMASHRGYQEDRTAVGGDGGVLLLKFPRRI